MWAGIVFEVITAFTRLLLALNAHVPAVDITPLDGRRAKFSDTIKPIPLCIGIPGLVIAAGSLLAILS